MSKKMYLPTEEDLKGIERLKSSNKVVDINAYGYLIVKAIEKILVGKANGVLIGNMDDYILRIPEIVYSICWVYPEELKNFDKIKEDESFCKDLLLKETDKSIYNLDTLAMYSPGVEYSHSILHTTLDILNKKLVSSPEYRFEYQESDLLNSIFNFNHPMFEDLSFDDFTKLKNIDATYALKYGVSEHSLYGDFHIINKEDKELITHRKGMLFNEGLERMLARYHHSNSVGYGYQNIDITSTNDEKIKRLKRFLNN